MHKKELANWNIRQWKLLSLRNENEKTEEKLTEPKGPVEHHQTDQHTHLGVPEGEQRERGRGREKIEEIMAENFPDLMKFRNL